MKDPIKKVNEEIKILEGQIIKGQKSTNVDAKQLRGEMGLPTKYDLTDDGKGKKYDNGKPMPGTLVNVFPEALLAVGATIEFGTHKYPDPRNWRKVEGANKRYQDSLMRHLIKYNMGEINDRETGIPHLAHMAWNALAILELYLLEHPEVVEEYLK